MQKKMRVFTTMLIGVSTVLCACNSSDDVSTNTNTQVANSNLEQKIVDETLERDETEIEAEDVSQEQDNTKEVEQELTSHSDKESQEDKKGDYLKKLNEMEEADRQLEPGVTMAELEEQEEERYRKWDEELNKIYGVLKEQLKPEEMDKLREEQREWIIYRDNTAKESSLKYEGGSTETLEYIATQATLTRERCYELVAKYMQ
ncbi:lysozyme inhibitor LprI family protein [Alkalihalobacterium bogoriense]|uniref:lysozyme inhibitor LprI family protein n=1 Tax=Alkalihalobacterium bogoriense TaxID=246272 RepID=UPI00047B1478|nr:lysozyme inhibitor LprI family protein [Alkalihalobacterium bogoriense]